MSTTSTTNIDPLKLSSFRDHLSKSRRIVALLGAGLSASSGLPTFRGAGGLWRTHEAAMLATRDAFAKDSALVWQFYSYRRHMALNAKPNPAHMALAELSKKKPEFMTLSQNVDGLSPRAGHPAAQLKLLHGSLFDIKCSDENNCGYIRENDYTDPIVPALRIPQQALLAEHELQTGQHDHSDSSNQHSATSANPLVRGVDISNADVPLSSIPLRDLPTCPQCKAYLLRPGVVWFGEELPKGPLDDIHAYFSAHEKIDLMLVIGTSSQVYPAAGYTGLAREKGARVAVVNMDPNHQDSIEDQDWFFEGDAAKILPELFRNEIGEVEDFQESTSS